MQHLSEAVEQYLKMDTNYALMITGKWGTGKTHYLNNTLKREVSKISLFNNDIKKYKLLLISLFGIKSLEDLQAEIFLSLYPTLKSKGLKLTSAIGNVIIKGIALIAGKDQYSKYIDYVEKTTKSSAIKLITFEDLVICFDDLERVSSTFNIEEILGFISTLVERENVKVLIVANQEEGPLRSDTFKDFKEKVIGYIIEFTPSITDTYDSILKDKFTGSPTYLSFLKANKEFILGVFSKKTPNFRTLIFALSYFQQIFSEIEMRLSSEISLINKKKEIILHTLKFTLAISIEYKENQIDFKIRNNLDDYNLSELIRILSPKNINNISGGTNQEKSYSQSFIETYYKNDEFNFFKSIYDYLTGGTAFKYSVLLSELNTIYHIDEGIIPPQYEILRKLDYQSYYMLDNREYFTETRKMLNFAYDGSYDIKEYLTVFHFATRLNNPLGLDLNKLVQRIIKGMNKGKKKYKYKSKLDTHLTLHSSDEHINSLIEIRNAALKLNNEILSETWAANSNKLEVKCYENFDEFFQIVLGINNTGYSGPIFRNFNADKFYLFIIKSSPARRWKILEIFQNYLSDSVHSQLIEEISFFNKLLVRVNSKTQRLSNKNIEKVVYSELKKSLQGLIEKAT